MTNKNIINHVIVVRGVYTMSKFCDNCGTKLEEGAKFCPKCGKAVLASDATEKKNAVQMTTKIQNPPVSQPVQTEQLTAVLQSTVVQPQNEVFLSQPNNGASLQKFTLLKVLLLSFITLGIYSYYFMVKLADNVHTLIGRKTTASGARLVIYTILGCGIYSLYFYYKMAESLNEARAQRHLVGKGMSGATVIVLFLVPIVNFVGIFVVMYRLIHSMDELIDFDAAHVQ